MIIQASARTLPLDVETVQCVVTSPPYWGLRQYAGEQRETWADGWYGALGLEPTPEMYVAHIVEVFREVRRVLRKDGTLWLNLGDSYAGSGMTGGTVSEDGGAARTARMFHGNRRDTVHGLKQKDLVGIPWMVAFALRADGWYLRSDIIWAKPNPMPESITDRPTKAHEYLFLLAKSQRYYYDADAIRETGATGSWAAMPPIGGVKHVTGNENNTYSGNQPASDGNRNKRTVWTIATQPYAGAHFATFPEALVEPCILAGSAAKACGVCGAPWERVTERGEVVARGGSDSAKLATDATDTSYERRFGHALEQRAHITTGWQPTCEHDDGSAASRVLDPFNGSGTTGAVALRLGREYVGTDLSLEYLAMSKRRLYAVTPVAHTIEHAAKVAGNGGAQMTMIAP